VRLIVDGGWGLVRASNTQPLLVLRWEATSEARLREIQRLIEQKPCRRSGRTGLSRASARKPARIALGPCHEARRAVPRRRLERRERSRRGGRRGRARAGQEKHRLLSKEPPQVAEAVLRAAKTACGAAGLPFSEMKAMGLGVAGMIDRSTGWCAARRPSDGTTCPSSSCLQARTPRTRLWISSELSVSAWGERAVGGVAGERI